MNLKSITAQSAVALSLVSACSLSHAGFLDNLFASSTKEPVALSTTTQEIMKNHTVWVIDGKDTSAWSVVEGKKPRRGAAPLLLKQDRGDLGLIPAQTDAGYIATKTEKISLSQPTSVVFEKNGSAILKFGAGKNPVQIDIKLRAFDVSGLKMAEFLKNRKGQPIAEAEKVGSEVFPAGSIAYKADTTFLNDEMVIPVNQNFTSATTSEELLKNFSSIPFCLKRVSGHAYGIMFDQAAPKAVSGTFKVTPVKRETMFCTPTGEAAVATGKWTVVNNGRSHAVVLTMPKEVTPAEYGIEEHESGVSKMAFVAPGKGDKIFRPGKFFAKGTTLESRRFYFNTTAAEAILKAAK